MYILRPLTKYAWIFLLTLTINTPVLRDPSKNLIYNGGDNFSLFEMSPMSLMGLTQRFSKEALRDYT